MKTFLKVLKFAAIIFVSLLLLLVAAGWIFQKQITDLAVTKVSEIVGAPLGMSKASLSLVRRFPMATVEFDDLWLGSEVTVDSLGNHEFDTLVNIERIYFSMKTMPLLNNEVKIRKVEVKNGHLNYFVHESGATSFDFLMASDTTAIDETDTDTTEVAALPEITLDELLIHDLHLHYKDDQQAIKVNLLIDEFLASALVNDSDTMANMKGAFSLEDSYLAGTPLDRLDKADLDFDLAFDSDTLSVKKMSLLTRELLLETSGKLGVGQNIYSDIDLSLAVDDIAAFTKYVPDSIFDEYDIKQLAGSINLTSNVTGELGGETLPHYEAQLSLSNGSLRYESYPLVSSISLDASANNGDKNDNSTTAITLNNFSLNTIGSELSLKGYFENLDRLSYRLSSNLDINLLSASELIPDTLVQNLKGGINAQLQTQGVLPDSIDDDFIDYAMRMTTLNVDFSDINFDMGKDLSVRNFSSDLNYQERSLTLDKLNVSIPNHKVDLVDNSLTARIFGSPMDLTSLQIQVPSFLLGPKGATLSGNLDVKNLEQPSFSLNTKLDANLEYVKRFAPDTLVNDMKGRLVAHLRSKGSISPDGPTDKELDKILYRNTRLDLSMKNISLDMVDTMMNVSKFKGDISYNSKRLAIDELSGVYQGISFSVDETKVRNLVSTVIQNKPGTLEVECELGFGDLDYAMLGAFMGSDDSEDEAPKENSEPTEESEPQNWDVKVDGKIFIDSFKYDEITKIYGIGVNYDVTYPYKDDKGSTFEVKGKMAADKVDYMDAKIKNVTGLYNFKDATYILDQVKYQAFDGSGETSMRIEMGEDEEMVIKMKNIVESIDMKKVFQGMRDFDQSDMLSYKNLDGIASSDGLYLSIRMLGDSLIYEDMRMSGHFSVPKLAIYNYDAIKELEVLPGMKDLDTLVFKPINDKEIFIFKNNMGIPKIFLINNKFDAEFSAIQSFGEDFKYLISVPLGQFVFSKSKKRKEKQDALGDQASDKREDQKFKHVITSFKDGKFKNDLVVSDDERKAMSRQIRVKGASNKIQFHPELFVFETGVE